MKIELRLIDTLIPYIKNPRKNEKAIPKVKASLQEFGFRQPIVVDTKNVIVVGHTRWLAAKQLGLTEVPVHVADSLTPSQIQAYRLTDNRTNQDSEWDDELLKIELSELKSSAFNLELTGFDSKEIDKLLMDSLSSSTQEDETPEVPSETNIKLGDLFILGNHRVLCGDSCNIDHVNRLMDNQVADMVFSDPPYGYNYQSNMRTKSDKFKVLVNDDKILSAFIKPSLNVSNGWFLICTSWKVITQWIDESRVIGDLSNIIVWDKGGGGIGDLEHTLSTDYELILAYNRGATIKGKRIGSVWSINKDSSSSYQHATQKPVELPALAMTTFTNKESLIYDPFLGSGTTLIAAEQLGKRCLGMEIEPTYVQVIIDRWEKLSQKKAILESCDGQA